MKKWVYATTILSIFCLFLVWFCWLRFIEYTDDAYVEGNLVYITPLHPGFVTTIHTDDTFLVTKGQPLVELDRRDAEIGLERAEETLAQTVREVCELFHQLSVYGAEIELKTAELIRDAQDYTHRAGVFQELGVSLEDYEHAIAALRAQYASLKMSGALYNKTLAAIQGTSIHNHPLVIAAKDAVRDAWVRLHRCTLYAPVTGLVAQRTIQVGMWAPSGQPLMSVIPLDQIWVNANYKETQMKHMRIGQKVDIRADLWGIEQVFHGRIVGLPGGAGNVFSLLPPQNLSGNWIKIVQRLPVRVALDPEEIRAHPLRVGLTCRAITHTDNRDGLQIPETSAGSPHYQTSIFLDEEFGEAEVVDKILAVNTDPDLSQYAKEPIHLASCSIRLPTVFREAIRQDTMLQKEIPKPAMKETSALFDFLYREYLR